MVVTNPNMVAPIAKTQTNTNQTNSGVSPALTSETAKQATPASSSATPKATAPATQTSDAAATKQTAPQTTEQRQTNTSAPVTNQADSAKATPKTTPAQTPVKKTSAPTEQTASTSAPLEKTVVPTTQTSAPVATEKAATPAAPVAKEGARIVATSQASDNTVAAPTESASSNAGLTANVAKSEPGSVLGVDNYVARNNVQALNLQGSQLFAAKNQRDRNDRDIMVLDTTATAQPIHVTVNYTNGGKTISSVSETVQGGQPLDIQGHMPSGYQVSGPFSTGTVTDGQTVNVPVVPVSSGTQATMHVTVDYDYNGKTVASVPMTVDNGSTIDVAGHIPSGYQSAGTWNADHLKDGDTLHVPVVPTNSTNTDNSDTSNSGSSTTGNSGNTSSTPSTSGSSSSTSKSKTIYITYFGGTDENPVVVGRAEVSSADSPNSDLMSVAEQHVPAGYKVVSPSGESVSGDAVYFSVNVKPISGSQSGSANSTGNSSSTPATGNGSSSSDSSQSSNNGSSNGSQSSSDNSQSGSQNSTPTNGNSSSSNNSQSSTDESDIPLTINWVDKTTGKTIGSTQVNLKPGSTNDITSLCPKGYRIDGSWNQENITKDTKTANVPVVPVTDNGSASDQTNSDKKGINIDVSANAHAKAKGKANANVNANTDNKAKGQGTATGNAKSCGMNICDDGLGSVVTGDDAAPEQLGAVIESAPAEEATPVEEAAPVEGQGSVLVPETVSMPETGQKSGSVIGGIIAGIAALFGFSGLMKRKATK